MVTGVRLFAIASAALIIAVLVWRGRARQVEGATASA